MYMYDINNVNQIHYLSAPYPLVLGHHMILCSTAHIIQEKVKISHICKETRVNNESVSDRLLVSMNSADCLLEPS